MRGNNRIDFANTLRGLAALSVVVSHYLGVFWQYPAIIGQYIGAPELDPASHPLPALLAWVPGISVFDWGAYGVALFFLISGFVIPFSLQKTNWLGFCLQRFFRLVPTYIAGFSLTLLAFYISTRYFGSSWRFTTPEILIHYLPGLRDLIGSRNIDTIVWTLEVEIKFYVLCAILIVWLRRYARRVFLVPAALSTLALILTPLAPQLAQTQPELARHLLTYLFSTQCLTFMFIGVLFHYQYQRKISTGISYAVVATLFGLFCLQVWQAPYFHFITSDSILSYALALLTFGFAYVFPKYFKTNPVVDFFADISYPLYVVHSVVGYVGLRILLDQGMGSGLALLAVFTLSVGLAWGLHWFVELPSQRWGKRFKNIQLNPAKGTSNYPL